MSTLAELEAEVVLLKKELAALRADFDQVITVTREDDGTVCDTRVSAYLMLAQVLVMQGPKKQLMGMLSSDETGSFINLFGHDDKMHVQLSATGNTGSVRVVGDNGDSAVEMTEDQRHGQVVAFSPGNVPRAILKGMATGGSIAALSPEGKPRALVHSINDNGEVLVAKDEVHAKLSSSDAGGSLSVCDAAGKRATTVYALPMGNGIAVHKPGAEATISLVATPLGASVRVGLVGEGTEKKPAIDLQELPGHGGQIMCRDRTAAVAIDMGSTGEGGSIAVSNGAQGGEVSLRTADGGGVVEATRTDSENRVLVMAARTGAVATVIGGDDSAAYLQITPAGSGSIGLKKHDQMQGFLGVSDDGQSGVIMLTNRDNSNAVNLSAGKEGGRIILGSNDGTTQASLFSSGDGSQLTLFNELGIERATLVAKQDSGGLHLRYGGHTGIVAAATESGGIMTFHDKDGEIAETLPEDGWDEDGAEPE